ncbi:MAG: recombinase family protein [Pseudomonadota bacterium]
MDEAEAEKIQNIYALYQAHGALNVVVTEAAKIGLRSRKRQAKNCGWCAGKIMARGHIHHILTSPINAGRIPHKGKTYEGQHPAIVGPERWDAVQEQLKRGPLSRVVQ